MKASKKTKPGIVGAAVLAGVLTVGGFALTDQLTVPSTSHAGDSGAGTAPEALTASAVHYKLLAANPSRVAAIDFTLNHAVAAGGSVFIQPVHVGNGGGSTADHWYSCVITGTPTIDGQAYTPSGTAPVCDTTGTQLDAIDIDQVRVVAAD